MIQRHLLALTAALLVASVAPQTPLLGAPTAHAKDSAGAELHRLTEDMERLARRNAWTGVERKYAQLLELDVKIRPDVHMLGYESARNLGDMSEAYTRLQRSIASADPTAPPGAVQVEAKEALTGIESSYGRVSISVAPKRIPALIRPEMPFAMDQRKSIEYAQQRMVEEHGFVGLLPSGRYMVDGLFFEVAAGMEVLEVVVPDLDTE